MEPDFRNKPFKGASAGKFQVEAGKFMGTRKARPQKGAEQPSTETEAELDLVRSQLKWLGSKLAEAKAELAEAKAELAEAKAELAEAKAELARLEAENNRLQEQLAEAKAECPEAEPAGDPQTVVRVFTGPVDARGAKFGF